MNGDTRTRLLEAAAALFAEQGFRGASVRDICNLAAANPGAVSYHFGGKRQLYRAVLRQAAEELATVARQAVEPEGERQLIRDRRQQLLRELLHRVEHSREAVRLLLHDLADGGGVAVEALVPSLRAAYNAMREEHAADREAGAERAAQIGFLRLAAPLFLLTAARPVIERTLDLTGPQQEELLAELIPRDV